MNLHTDFSKEKNRTKAINDLAKDCKISFIEAGVHLAKNAKFRLGRSEIEIYLVEGNKPVFASEVNIYYNRDYFTNKEKININFGSSGCFSDEDSAPFWRTIHAANILMNWSKACEVANTYFKKYAELENMIIQRIKP